MATWDTVSFNLAPLNSLNDYIGVLLKGLNAVEAVLEKVLDLVKAFSIDLGNPLKAIVATLLAAIRNIINQVRATGLAFLLVHPDFSRQDVSSTFGSVSGSYPAFEQKLIYKLNDTSDLYRPSYPDGSAVGMMIIYVGAESPGDLMLQLKALLQFLKHPTFNPTIPAPVDVKVRPVLQGNSVLGQLALAAEKVADIFNEDFDKALSIEWRMPSAPSGSPAPGYLNSFVSTFSSYKYQRFIIERSKSPDGQGVEFEVNTQTTGAVLSGPLQRYGLQAPKAKFFLKEPDGVSTYRFFEKKFVIDFSTSSITLIPGILEGTYKFIDTSSDLEEGVTYYYRIRAYYGNVDSYISSSIADIKKTPITSNTFIKKDKTNLTINYGNNASVGRASASVRGVIPKKPPSGLNLYNDLYDAVMAGLLLNFELPPSDASDTTRVKDQKTGWGSLSMIAGTASFYKTDFAVNSEDLKESFAIKTLVRKIVNQVISELYTNVKSVEYLDSLWSKGPVSVQSVVAKVLRPTVPGTGKVGVISWKFPSYDYGEITSGFSSATKEKINNYLALESGYNSGSRNLDGPFPTYSSVADGKILTVNERSALAGFLGSALSGLSNSSSYLRWYSISLGDLFPAFLPFIFDFEQFMLALLKAFESAATSIANIIETLIQKIRQLEQILSQIMSILDILSISLKVSVLTYSSTNGSVNSLVQAIQSSDQKPFSSPYGLHSGAIVTVGGTGQGVLDSFKAVKYVFGIG